MDTRLRFIASQEGLNYQDDVYAKILEVRACFFFASGALVVNWGCRYQARRFNLTLFAFPPSYFRMRKKGDLKSPANNVALLFEDSPIFLYACVV